MTAVVAIKDIKLLPDADLRRHATSFGLDSLGPRKTLIDRIARHIRTTCSAGTGLSQSKTTQPASLEHNNSIKKHRRKKTSNGAARQKNGNKTDGSAKDSSNGLDRTHHTSQDDEIDAIVEYVPETIGIQLQDSPFETFAQVFAKFVPAAETGDGDGEANEKHPYGDQDERDDMELDRSDNDSQDDDLADGDNRKSMSKKKQRKVSRLTVAELKQLVTKPEVVDWVDVTAADPKLLVHLKASRNTVSVPIHWMQKRKYLQGKRGVEKMPFELPDFIKQTGITQMRDAVKEKEDATKLKSKTRERHQPKMGKLEIDYQKLHDAFFRWQTKPKLSIFGDVYFEGKEFETKLKLKKPGNLSNDLVMALGIPPLAPPPWLINMQRYGPPPSYPQLKIPGLNAPIPDGAQWGYHPGGWGKPPVDEFNRPLYGDVFGTSIDQTNSELITPIVRTLWAELESDEEEEVEEEEEEEDQDDEENDDSSSAPPAPDGLVTPSGLASVPSGLETPNFIELRKRPMGEPAGPPKQLYTVVEQKETSIKGFMGSQHVYDMSNVTAASSGSGAAVESAASKASAAKRKLGIVSSAIQVSLNPDDLADGLDDGTLKRKFDQEVLAVRAEAAVGREDFSDMVAENAQKQAKKRQKKDESSNASGNKRDKTKDFKF
ncbi:hypothetical protein BATDEDRAFT_35091 [Batrachochytrium dendrobatidis JAM81]|uniref:SAP domain-containing protein n=2 Tax=Batrachochytrium dendrobatidis TaxID=109871 RepID=F4P312_BATDJ|nr:U2 snRNP complex subunit CUS1 [Batrachochytrium dendrobatidis JAM81]EGF80398.1 hypothetical protein BATDEDRAFT_35091 [Batrachochytrium dendrobatidis JAM81]KAJ8326557.1 hypothetical protein O5D80_005296 [Batrachochytrium dendrobatidis]KAK5666661.1 hypothetical protein QVD99_006724 [Batrachochytrium dendrobatidis]OAJ41200.1 hypothetical protein BDEG_24834 [Batrachochytrium dendrobatidis JEL423]|eukprot:XP_006679104.1 hypothetical protein BATDEDRAFT_35091 [Batrachochytrium dendrobatidis JAM81]